MPRIDKTDSPAWDVVQPSEPWEESGDDGLLLADLGPVKQAWVGSVDIVGAYDAWELDSEDGEAARFPGRPGTYDVWWLDGEGRRLGTFVRLDAGKVTRLRLADCRAEAPIPHRLGVLSVFVEAAEGGGLPAEVHILSGHGSIDVWANEDGYASLVIRPGSYTVTVGDQRSTAVVEEGRTTIHRIAHDREGDLVLVADLPLKVSVRPSGEPDSSWEGWVGPGPEPVPYLKEGEYDLFIPYAFGAPLAHATVRAGRTTRLRFESPTGGLLVHVVPASSTLYIGLFRGGDPKASQVGSIRLGGGQTDPVRLMPGRYVVTAHASGCETASTEIEVVDRVIEVTLELAPSR